MNQMLSQYQINGENNKKDRREGKGRVLALSRRIYRLLRQKTSSSDVYYVESESSDDQYYFVKFKPDVLESCSCKDNSTRGLKCKHLFAIEFAIKWGTIKDTDKLPTGVKEDIQITSISKSSSSYKDDEYTF